MVTYQAVVLLCLGGGVGGGGASCWWFGRLRDVEADNREMQYALVAKTLDEGVATLPGDLSSSASRRLAQAAHDLAPGVFPPADLDNLDMPTETDKER